MQIHRRKSDSSSTRVILASQSYSRQRLISLAGLNAEVIPSDFDEYAVKQNDFPDKETYVSTIAAGKLLAVADQVNADEDTFIIGGDLMVFLEDTPYHKPTSFFQAREYIQTLSGKTHLELCATAFWSTEHGVQVLAESVWVTVPALTPLEIDAYLEIAHPLEKAGGFSIIALQKILRQRSPFESAVIDGSISALLGISLPKVEQFFHEVGLKFPVPSQSIEHQLSHEILTGEFSK